MQYKTIQVEHFMGMSRKDVPLLSQKYEAIINHQASEGWKLLGIHTLPVTRRAGCMKMCMGIFTENFQMDILIFFKE